MWMMGYNDSRDFNNMAVDSAFNSRRLRPLMPRPLSSSATASPNPSCALARFHGNDFVAFNHHLGAMAVGEQGKNAAHHHHHHQVVVSSRWNPTAEQLQTLEELYRRGTRTPSADQIQHITAQLRKYGKIEGKNVFYWFQNHKARERQKRRRQLESAATAAAGGGGDDGQPPLANNNATNCMENAESKDSGANRTCFEGEQQQQHTKNWPSPSTTLNNPEKSESIGRGTKAAVATGAGMMAAEEGWVHFEDNISQGADHILPQNTRTSLQEKNATWLHMMHLSSSSNSTSTSPSPPPPPPTYLDSTPMEVQLLNFFVGPDYKDRYEVDFDFDHNSDSGDDAQTLQLFPLRSGDDRENVMDDRMDETIGLYDHNIISSPNYQFFEFLPLKN